MKNAIDNNYPAFILDGKGDIGKGSVFDIVNRMKGNKKLYVVNMSDPEKSSHYNPFKNSSVTVAKDMLINMSDWSEEHYMPKVKINPRNQLSNNVQPVYYFQG